MGYSNSDIAHKWAHQLKEEIAPYNTLSAKGTKLFSYNTVIGEVFTFKNGNTCYIVQNGRFSASSSKHQNFMHSGIPDNNLAFPLHCNRAVNWSWKGYGGDNWHDTRCNEVISVEAQMKYLTDQAIDLLEAIEEYKTCTTLNVQNNKYPNVIWRVITRFCELSGEVSVHKLLNTKEADWKCASNDWYKCLKPERIRLIRKALRGFQSGLSLAEVIDSVCGEGTYQAYIDRTEKIRKGQATYRANAAMRQENAQRRALMSEKERILENLPADLRGEFSQRIDNQDITVYRDLYHMGIINSVPYKYYGGLQQANTEIFRGGNVLMRIKGKIVETSKGMKITFDECKRLWKFVCRWHENQNDFQRGERAITEGYNHGGWEIQAYLHDVLHAGCHSIAYDEMHDLAVALKIA